MTNSLSILILLAILVLTAALLCAGYLLLYRRNINRKLNQDGSLPTRRMIAPLWFGVLIVVATLVLLALFSRLFSGGTTPEIPDSYYGAVYDYQLYTPDQLEDGYLSLFSKEENPGYEKSVEVIDGVRYTIFLSTEAYDARHPTFLIYAEPLTVDSSITLSAYNGAFLTLPEDGGAFLRSTGAGGGDPEDFYCIAGSASVPCQFQFTLGFATDEEWEAVFSEMEPDSSPVDYFPRASTLCITLSPTKNEYSAG